MVRDGRWAGGKLLADPRGPGALFEYRDFMRVDVHPISVDPDARLPASPTTPPIPMLP